MAYEKTSVLVAKSQQAIRRLIFAHDGAGISFISQPPREGFEALVTIKDQPYRVRIMATCELFTNLTRQEQEERRVWRVLFWHIKAMFEASDSGVIDIRDVILPYIVTRDGRTFSEIVVPSMQKFIAGDVSKLLPAGIAE